MTTPRLHPPNTNRPDANRLPDAGRPAAAAPPPTVPAAYRDGYPPGRDANPALSDLYIRHTLAGDPLADAAVAALADLDQRTAHRLIDAGMERRDDEFAAAPPAVRHFFAALSTPPDWYVPTALLPGMRAYHQNSDLFIAAHVAGVLVSGFSTLISKSFFRTGRLSDYGIRRLQQNNRHLLEICLPGGLERDGDGWKLTVRIRLVHAQVRRLIQQSGEWDEASYGVPLHAAHIAFASAAFSALLLQMVGLVGARLTAVERDSFMAVWRYTAWLMGAPEPLLFRNYAEGLELCRIGFMLEPPPEEEAIIMANTLIHSAPRIVGYTEREQRRKFANFVYQVSRALIGHELADQLRFPRQNTTGALFRLRLQRRLLTLLDRIYPMRKDRRRSNNFITLLERSLIEDAGIQYWLPDNLDADKATPW